MKLNASLLFICLSVSVSALAAEAPSTRLFLVQGTQHFKSGQWDESELSFMKAVKSSAVEERIEAYQGLTDLYTKLHMYKKAGRVQKMLEEEKQFQERLVPADESYYDSYEVLAGDTYAKIAQHYRVSLLWLVRANKNEALKPGIQIRVPKVFDALEVDKNKKTLTWRRGAEVLKIYPISIGHEGSETPEGTFKIINKARDPIWYRLHQEYPPDSPKNLLGTRWMGLNQKGYGIHGTRNPRSIGTAASHGCVRMFNQDVEELFEWMPLGTEVVIHAKRKS